MRKILRLRTSLIFFLLCVFGCENHQTTDRKNEISTPSDSLDYPLSEKKSGFSSSLWKVIEDFIEINIAMENNPSYPIYALTFEHEKEQCYMRLTTTHFYDSARMIGYEFLDKYLIYVEKGNLECFSGLIDTSKLQSGKISNSYLNKNSEELMYIFFDPYQRKYKIHGNDSLELIYEGFW